jgi:hypothetical protein
VRRSLICVARLSCTLVVLNYRNNIKCLRLLLSRDTEMWFTNSVMLNTMTSPRAYRVRHGRGFVGIELIVAAALRTMAHPTFPMALTQHKMESDKGLTR